MEEIWQHFWQSLQSKRNTKGQDYVWTHLDIREEHLEHIRTRVAGVEKHELGLLQMIGGETLLDLQTAAIKDINDCLEGKQLMVDEANEATDIIRNTICAC